MPSLLLVDGHAIAYRAFHAIRHLSAPDGQPTNAIFGFIKMLARFREAVQPTHLAVVWDAGLSPERLDLLPDYKASRPPMPPDLESQIAAIISCLDASRVASVRQPGVEADDLLATIARTATAAGAQVVIASSDKDFFQLVSTSVGLLNPADKSGKIWRAADVLEKTGVEPSQVVDWLSLVGDAVDGIPGVPGVGPKTAAGLLCRFGAVDALYARLDEVESDRVRGALRESENAVRRNQKMIRLRDDLPGTPALGDMASVLPDAPRLAALYQRWGFKSMAAELQRVLPAGQGSLFSF
jgi:DNA polymerase-1